MVLSTMKVTNDDFPVRLTPKALEMALAALKELDPEDGSILRVGIKGGGCAGFQYSLDFINNVDELDILTDIQQLQVAVDIFSATPLSGTEVDYVETIQGGGFKFINPNAKRTCGCGSSFAG